MAPRRALREILAEPSRRHERLFLVMLTLIIVAILLDTASTFALIIVGDRRIARSQAQILDVSRRVALNTEQLRILDEQHYLNLLQFRALSAQLNAVRQTLALPKAAKKR